MPRKLSTCPLCNGTKKVQSRKAKVARCPKCNGDGAVVTTVDPWLEVKSLERGESPRGDAGLFGEAMIHDTTNGLSEIKFSRLDGEDEWFVDSLKTDDYIHFNRSPGYRLGKRYALVSWMKDAVDSEAKTKGL